MAIPNGRYKPRVKLQVRLRSKKSFTINIFSGECFIINRERSMTKLENRIKKKKIDSLTGR